MGGVTTLTYPFISWMVKHLSRRPAPTPLCFSSFHRMLMLLLQQCPPFVSFSFSFPVLIFNLPLPLSVFFLLPRLLQPNRKTAQNPTSLSTVSPWAIWTNGISNLSFFRHIKTVKTSKYHNNLIKVNLTLTSDLFFYISPYFEDFSFFRILFSSLMLEGHPHTAFRGMTRSSVFHLYAITSMCCEQANRI